MCLVPDGDFFAAIKSGQAEVVTDHIDDVHPGRAAAALGRASWRPT